MKNKKTFIIMITGALVLFALYLFVFKKKTPVQIVADIKKRLFLGNASFPLKLGSTGLQVLFFQAFLNKYHENTLALDGIWGPKTNAAAKFLNYDTVTQDFYNSNVKVNETELKAYLTEKNINY